MTSESKTNLLRTLLNEAQESPGENKSTFTDKFENTTTQIENALTFDQLQWNGYTIGLNGDYGVTGGYLYLYDQNGNQVMKKKPNYKDMDCDLISIDIDENGDLYGLMVRDNVLHLAYFYNPFMKTADGEYDLIVKIAYNLRDDVSEMFNTIGGNDTAFCTDIKKSPIDSRFLITWCFGNANQDYNLISILYTVNVGSSNTFDYRYSKIGTYNYTWIKNVQANWTNDNVSFSIVILNCDFERGLRGAKFYKTTGNFSNGSSITNTLMLDEDNYFSTDFTSNPSRYANSKNAVQKDGVIYFVSNKVIDSNTKSLLKIYKYDTSLSIIWQKEGLYNGNTNANNINLVKINNQIFSWASVTTEDEGEGWWLHDCYFMHIVGSNINEIKAMEGHNYMVGFVGIIQNFFNFYVIYLKISHVGQYILTYVYRPDKYNGQPYYSDQSTIAEATQLKNDEGNVIFDRNLYDKQLTNNMVSCIAQVPFNYLNDVIISNENLISKTNSIIDNGTEEIEKNMYEELIISFLDQFKVYDNNYGSSYNSNSSLEIAKNVYNGFSDNYKLTHYRINKGNTHTDYPLKDVVRTGNVAEITLFIYYNGEDNIQLYDSDFTVPFLTIDVSKLEIGKLYMLKQKVKVE